MSDKTLGQVVYEGWDSDVMTNSPWDEVPAGFQAAWQGAAEAVIEHYLTTETEAPLDFIKYRHEVRAVIEAAKAWLHEQIHDPNSVRNVTCQYTKGALGLTLAIEALQEVEGG